MTDQAIQRHLEKAVADRVFSGAQVALHHEGKCVLSLAVGNTAFHESKLAYIRPVSSTSLFDVASVTKAVSTSVLLMQAVHEGRIQLDQSIGRWFPNWCDPHRPDSAAAQHISVAQLCGHESGLKAHRPFFEVLRAEHLTAAHVGRDAARRRLLALIAAEPPQNAPGTATHYSDLGYMLLGWILEIVLERDLATAFTERVAGPLGLERCGYCPLEVDQRADRHDIAATERAEAGEWLQGAVHDDNARSTGGVEGHAGLFSNASDLAVLMDHLGAVDAGASGIVSPHLLRQFWEPKTGSAYTLGWDTPTPPGSLTGSGMTVGETVGHWGFTGCGVWYDRKRRASFVFSSNRVHPDRSERGIRKLRPTIHDLMNALLSRSVT